MSENKDELSVIEPIETRVTVRGKEGAREVIVRPLVTAQFPPFFRALRPAMPQLSGLLDGEVDLVGLVAEHGEAVIEAVHVATSVSKEDLGALDLDDFMKLVGVVLKVNADFFVQRLVPMLSDLVKSASSMVASVQSGAGRTPSTP